MKKIIILVLLLDLLSVAKAQVSIPFRKGDKWGLANADRKIILPCEYDNIRQLDSIRYLLFKDGYVQLANNKGQLVSTQQFLGISKFNDNTYQVFLDKHTGLINSWTVYSIQPVYTSLIQFPGNLNLLEVQKDGKVGLIDYKENIKIPIVYDAIRMIDNKMLILTKDRKFQLANSNGELIDQTIYEDIIPLKNGLIQVKLNGKWGCINNTGQTVIPPTFDRLVSFNKNFILVGQDNKYGIYNNNGQLIVEPLYEASMYSIAGNNFWVKKDNNWYQISKGTVITPCEFTSVIDTVKGYFKLLKGDDFVLADSTGKPFFNKNFEDAYPMNAELFAVQTNKKWGICNKKGELSTSFTYDEIIFETTENESAILKKKQALIWNLPEITTPKGKTVPPTKAAKEMAVGKVRIDRKWALINAVGKELTSFKYDNIQLITVNGPFIVDSSGWFGIVNNKGIELLPLSYNRISFDEKTGHFVTEKTGLRGIMKADGKIISEPKYLAIIPSQKPRLFTVQTQSGWGCLNINGSMMIPATYEQIADFGEYFQFVQKGKTGLMDKTGKILIPALYDNIFAFKKKPNLLLIQMNNKMGLINTQGKIILPAEYDEIQTQNKQFFNVKYQGKDGLVRKDGTRFFEL